MPPQILFSDIMYVGDTLATYVDETLGGGKSRGFWQLRSNLKKYFTWNLRICYEISNLILIGFCASLISVHMICKYMQGRAL